MEHDEMQVVDRNPFQNFNLVSQVDIFSLLPEIWDDIISHLSSQDFHSLINTCPEWRKMFNSHKTSKLLPLTLPILLNNHDYLSYNDLLHLRQVSHRTKSAVDELLLETPTKYFENLTTLGTEWSSRVKDKRHPLRGRIERCRNFYEFYSTRQIEEFTGKYSELGRIGGSSPFICKSLIIPLVNMTQIYQNYQNLNHLSTNMMRALGHTINAIHFDGLLGINVSHFYTLLSFLPNLKVLKIRGILYPGQREDVERAEQNLQLNKLELLDIEQGMDYEDEGNQMGLVCASIIRRVSHQLTRLVCAAFVFRNAATVEALISANLGNLRGLRVNAVNGALLGSILGTLVRLENLPELEQLQLAGRSEQDDVGIGGVLDVVNGFAESLTNLQLNLTVNSDGWVVEGGDDDNEAMIMIPLENLIKFSTLLRNIDKDWFWPFIELKCQNLRELNFNGVELRGGDVDGVRRAFELLPKLRRVLISCGFQLRMERNPETVVVERNGTVRRRKFQTSS